MPDPAPPAQPDVPTATSAAVEERGTVVVLSFAIADGETLRVALPKADAATLARAILTAAAVRPFVE